MPDEVSLTPDMAQRLRDQVAAIDAAEDERRKSVLFNDITRAPLPSDVYFRFSDRLAMRDYLWEQGWRRDVRPEDVTERPADA